MDATILPLDHTHILNHCAKHLARDQGPISEPWRFPLIDQHLANVQANRVTFVLQQATDDAHQSNLIGTFAPLYQAIPLQRVQQNQRPMPYVAVSLLVPHGQVHQYVFQREESLFPDEINPQQQIRDSGQIWSRLFTDFCHTPLCFEIWERKLLQRLCKHILPFNDPAAERFLRQHYYQLQSQKKRYDQSQEVHQLDHSVGESNYIDKVLAREESHHLIDYKICLGIIEQLMRQRNPYEEPHEISRQLYMDLFNEMANNQVVGWPLEKYDNPAYFLRLLRRHTVTGAFSHPKYGGNIGAAGWAYLQERFNNENGSLFDWRKAMEAPLGTSEEYLG